jgi:hypothetical protein
MTTKPKARKAAAANAGLPAIDRRSLVCGLGTAAVAGVPALASAASMSDPVFQAMAALDKLKIHVDELEAAYSVFDDAFFNATRGRDVTLDGEKMLTHEQIDAHFTPAFGPDEEEEFNKILGRIETLRPRRLSDAERAELNLARQAAHDDLTRREAEIAEVEEHIGYREIEAQQKSADDAVWNAEYDVMEAKPATPAGAVALLRLVAELMEGSFLPGDDEHEHYAGAIRNAADFFEGSASA